MRVAADLVVDRDLHHLVGAREGRVDAERRDHVDLVRRGIAGRDVIGRVARPERGAPVGGRLEISGQHHLRADAVAVATGRDAAREGRGREIDALPPSLAVGQLVGDRRVGRAGAHPPADDGDVFLLAVEYIDVPGREWSGDELHVAASARAADDPQRQPQNPETTAAHIAGANLVAMAGATRLGGR